MLREPSRMVAPGHADHEPNGSSGGTEARPRRRWWVELALAAALYAVYDAIHGAIRGDIVTADRDGRDLLHTERLLHLDPETWLNHGLDHIAVLAVPACWIYASLHFLVTPGVLVWTYRARPTRYSRARNVLAVSTLTALLGFWRFPTAPPRLLPGSRLHDTLALFHSWGWWGSNTSVPAPAKAFANAYAAFPSLHVAWAVWCGATVYAAVRRPGVRVLAVLYPVLIALVVLATANHYLIDVVAGGLLWLAAHLLVTGASHLWRRRRAANAPATARVENAS